MLSIFALIGLNLQTALQLVIYIGSKQFTNAVKFVEDLKKKSFCCHTP